MNLQIIGGDPLDQDVDAIFNAWNRNVIPVVATNPAGWFARDQEARRRRLQGRWVGWFASERATIGVIMKALVTVLTALSLAATCICQQAAPAAKRAAAAKPKVVLKVHNPEEKAPFVFEAGDVELIDLIERCGTYLHYNILFDGAALSSTMAGVRRARVARAKAPANAQQDPTSPMVSLQLPVVTDHNGCEELLSSILWSHGLSLVPLDEQKAVYEVLHLQGPRAPEIIGSAVRRTAEQVLARPMLRHFVTVVYNLEHTNAQMAHNALRPFFARRGNGNGNLQVGNFGNRIGIILSGPQFMVATAVEMLMQADVPSPDSPHILEAQVQDLTEENASLAKRLAALEEKIAKRSKRGG